MTTEDLRTNAEIIADARKVAKLYRGVGHQYGIEKNLELLADRLEAANKELDENVTVLKVLRNHRDSAETQRDVAQAAVGEAARMLGEMPVISARGKEVTVLFSEIIRVREYLHSVTDNRAAVALGTVTLFESRYNGGLFKIADEFSYPDPEKGITVDKREYRPVTPRFIGEYPTIEESHE